MKGCTGYARRNAPSLSPYWFIDIIACNICGQISELFLLWAKRTPFRRQANYLPGKNTLVYLARYKATKKMKWCECSPKPEFYITVGRKVLPGTNTLAYWAHYKATKKMKWCECSPKFLHNTRLERFVRVNTLAYWTRCKVTKKLKCCEYRTNLELHYARLERLAWDKHTCLLGPLKTYKESEVLWI
jgi:hypothetical protein